MTRQHPGHPTRPLTPGAPLPEGYLLAPLHPGDIRQELHRAETELMYALARHRKAWAAMRAHANDRAEKANSGIPGKLAALDADPVWKHRTGDVSWWRDEITAQATAVTALRQMLADRPEKEKTNGAP